MNGSMAAEGSDGNRLPLMLVPGTLCDARLWSPQIEALGHEVDTYVPRLGASDDMDALARDLLDQAPWPRFNLAGLSMGGILAMSMVRQASERIERLALFNTNPFAEVEERRIQRAADIHQAEEMGLERYAREVLAPLYPAQGQEPSPEHTELVVKMARGQGLETFRRQSLALRDRADASQWLGAVRQPTLVLCGDGDRLCPVSRHTWLADHIPDARLVVLEGVGHLSTLQAPLAVNHALMQWLGRPAGEDAAPAKASS